MSNNDGRVTLDHGTHVVKEALNSGMPSYLDAVCVYTNERRIVGEYTGKRRGRGIEGGIRERCEEYMTNDDERDGEVR